MPTFHIQGEAFEAPLDEAAPGGMSVRSVPYSYDIDFARSDDPGAAVHALIAAATDPIVLIDAQVQARYFANGHSLAGIPALAIEATEQAKTIHSAIRAAEFLEDNGAGKQGMYFVIGGGIVQDIGAFSAAMYKRGMPWTFVPTTMLAQSDSCVGGKTGLNHRGTKNLTALFSAPRRIVIDTGFLDTLTRADQLSGLGEAFRLCVTGGPAFLDAFERELDAWRVGDADAARRIIALSLGVKRAVVERDEFETDLRRSMNYGHSIGHALEALVDFRVPHGMAVTIGMLIENEISHARGLLPAGERDRMVAIGRHLVTPEALDELARVDLAGIVDVLRKDKKTLGSTLKLVVVEHVGSIRFIDFALDEHSAGHVRAGIDRLLQAL